MELRQIINTMSKEILMNLSMTIPMRPILAVSKQKWDTFGVKLHDLNI